MIKVGLYLNSLTSKMASIIVLADLAPLYHFIIAWAETGKMLNQIQSLLWLNRFEHFSCQFVISL